MKQEGHGPGDMENVGCHSARPNSEHSPQSMGSQKAIGVGKGYARRGRRMHDGWTWGDQMRTYKSTNLRGLRASTGSRKKQMTKQAAAPRLQAAKTNNLSQRLTVGQRTLATTSHKLVCRICITCRIDSGHSVHGPLQGLMRRGGRDVMGKKEPRQVYREKK